MKTARSFSLLRQVPPSESAVHHFLLAFLVAYTLNAFLLSVFAKEIVALCPALRESQLKLPSALSCQNQKKGNDLRSARRKAGNGVGVDTGEEEKEGDQKKGRGREGADWER
eukprot:344807-Hanusia_phi.AAC.14